MLNTLNTLQKRTKLNFITAAMFGCCMGLSSLSHAANIVIQVGDGANEGFNDSTPTQAVGGNKGTTLGEQRLNVFQVAAENWARFIDSDVSIVVEAHFESLSCSSTSAVLGSAGPTNVATSTAPGTRPDTFYSIALANALENSDLNGTTPEIRTRFNSNIDNNNNCLNQVNWYYGIDGNAPPYTIDLLAVVMHEIGHGLGFLSLMSSNGSKFYGMDDIYSAHLKDASSGQLLTNMATDNDRRAAIRNNGNLVWTGSQTNTSANNNGVSQGLNNGEVRMYAPTSYRGGSSVSHFDTTLSPNELMEPFATGPKEDPGLAVQLMYDIGWQQTSTPVNEAPTITDLPSNLDLETNHSTAQVDFVIGDAESLVSDLTLSAFSMDESVLPSRNISIDSIDSAGTVNMSIMYELNAVGATNVQLSVSDGDLSTEAYFQYKVAEPAETPDGPAPDAPLEITPAVLTLFDNAARRYEAEYAEYQNSLSRLEHSSSESDRLYAAWGLAIDDLAATEVGTKLHSIALTAEARAENRFMFEYTRRRGLIDENNIDIAAVNQEASVLNQIITDYALDVTPIEMLTPTTQLPETPTTPANISL